MTGGMKASELANVRVIHRPHYYPELFHHPSWETLSASKTQR